MNSLDIYRLLPRTNCGECEPRTCMAFAVALQAAPDLINQCIHIENGSRSTLKNSLVQYDWRDDLIKSLMEDVAKTDLDTVASDIGGIIKNGKVLIRCIGRDYLIDCDGSIEPDTSNKWIKILLLHYIRNKGKGDITGHWMAFSDLKEGLFKASTFVRECENPLREMFDNDIEAVTSALRMLGASKTEGFSSDYAWTLDLLPRIRILLIYRIGDEEFPSTLKVLFDSITSNFLDVESIIFLCEGFVHTLEHITKARRR